MTDLDQLTSITIQKITTQNMLYYESVQRNETLKNNTKKRLEKLKESEKVLKSKIESQLEKLDSIEVYVRILQDGDPENEKPHEILNQIDEILERKI